MTKQFTVQLNKSEVLNEVKTANRILDSKNNLPVTESIILSFSANQLLIKGTDGHKYFVSKIATQTSEDIEFSLSRELFLKTLEAVNKDSFTLSKTNEKITIQTHNEKGSVVFNSHLFAFGTEDVPKFPSTDLDNKIQFNTKLVQAVFEKTNFCVVKQDASRESLKGINIKKTGNDIEFASTDSYRLSLVHIEQQLNTNDFNIIVYPNLVNEILKQTSDSISLEFNDNYIVLKSGNRTMVFPLIQAQYPAIKPLFPTTHTQKLTVKVSEFKSLVESTSFIASKNTNNNFNVSVKNGEVMLSASHKDLGSIDLAVENVKVHEQVDFDLTLNNTYVKDVLSKLNPEHTLVLEFDGKKATVYAEESKLDFKHLIIGIISY